MHLDGPACNKHLEIVKFLVNLDIGTYYRKMVLNVSVICGNLDVVKVLVKSVDYDVK